LAVADDRQTSSSPKNKADSFTDLVFLMNKNIIACCNIRHVSIFLYRTIGLLGQEVQKTAEKTSGIPWLPFHCEKK
jgi:hypothetical protein